MFGLVVVTTVVRVRRLPIARPALVAGLLLATCAWLITSTVPPRTSRIFYDEQIYQDVGRNLSDLHLAQTCNDGNVDYGRLQCFRGEYNKEPYGYPYLLSIVYRAAVSDAAAFRFNNVVEGVAVLVVVVLADFLFADFYISILSGLLLGLMPMQVIWSATAASEPAAAPFCAAAAMAAVHFARARTTLALAWTIALSAFAMTLPMNF